MKTHGKLIIFVFTATLLLSLFGCAPATPVAPTLPPPTAVPPTATKPPATAVPPTATSVPPTATPTPKPVTITFTSWNWGDDKDAATNPLRLLVKAYTDAHPNVTIQFVKWSDPYDAFLTGLAAKGSLPDVFIANNVPLYVKNGWLADLTTLVSKDNDWKLVPQALRDDVAYSGKTMAVVAGQFLMGYWVNTDLYDAANLDAPAYGISAVDFFKLAKALTNIPKGKLGLDEQEFVWGWYANTVDGQLKYNSFDGTNMNYNSAAFKAGIAKAVEMKPYTWQGLSEAQMKSFKSKGPWELFLNQEVGVRWDGSWALGGWKDAKFNWDFIGTPGGQQCLVIDPYVVSKTASDQAAAYDFVKWISFSPAGYAKKVEIAKKLGNTPDLPVAMDPASVALFKTVVNKPGINKALANLDKSMTESLAKIIPGYIQARWEGKPGIDIGTDKDVNMWFMLNAATQGKIKFEDYSEKLEQFANKILSDARAAMKQP